MLLLRSRGGSPASLLCALAWWVGLPYAVGAWRALWLSFGVVCWSALRWGSWSASGGQLYPLKPEQFPSSGADHHAHASGVPPPESLSRCPSGAIFCLSSGVLHIFQLLTCAPIGGAVGDAWAVLISSTSTPQPSPNTKKSVEFTTL